MLLTHPFQTSIKLVGVTLTISALFCAPLGDFGSTALAGKGKGKGGGGGAGADGGGDTIFFRVTCAGDVQWQANPGDASTEPLSAFDGSGSLVVWRVAALDALNFLCNPNTHGDCMPHLDKWNWARSNVNFLASGAYTEGSVDGCAPINVNGSDRVYGDTLAVQNLTTDFLNNDTGRDIRLNFTPDDITYRLYYSVIASNRDISQGLDAALRALEQGESLILTLGGWELEPNKNRKNRTECVATGSFNVGTTITITRDDTPCDL